ncbi:MAG: hypothetical protein C4523_17595 [Myxococcales bacterium]|nr:MAG: hypothetical protein C4523_17595 [Myxococcales bacterium]
MLWLIGALFFLSGAASLVYETVWFRELALIFGSSSWAASTATAAFLGGLGLGGLAASAWIDRLRRRVLVYGLLEIFVGLYALATPAILSWLDAVQHRFLGGETLAPTAYAVVRFAVIFAALLLPTAAMGATLPVLVRAAADREETIGRRIGFLYGVNTLGALAGVLVAGFVLLPEFGQATATNLAAAVSIGVGLLAALFGLTGKTGAAPVLSAKESEWLDRHRPMRPYALVGAFLFFSGLGAMLIQISATRLLTLLIGASVYSFALTVAVFLAGIGLGSLVYAYLLAPRVEPYRLLAGGQGVLAVALVAMIYAADDLPKLLLAYAQSDAIDATHTFLVHATIAALLLFLPTLAMGVTFPAAVRLWAVGVGRVGKDVGRAYFANTAGSIVGSFAAGFLLIPSVGLQTTIAFAAGLAVFWAAFFGSIRAGFLHKKRAALAVPASMLVAMFLLFLPSWDEAMLTAGLYRMGLARRVAAEGDLGRPAMLYHRDGPAATVTVERRDDIVSMRINGKVEASNHFDMPTQVMVGLLPLLLHEKDEGHQAALVGWGSGVTAGAMLQTPLASLTAVELEPRVIEAARLFEAVNFKPAADPRLKLVVGDARTVLGYSARRFDVIVSEPSNPWVAGASSLFTVDFYQLMKRRLAEGGLYAQWIQLYELSRERMQALVRTFRAVFPHVLVFSAAERGVDLILVGSERPWSIDLTRLAARANAPGVTAALSAARLTGGFDVLSLLMVTDAELAAFAGEGPLNTDDNGLVEFAAPKDMLFYDDYSLSAVDFHFSATHGHFLPLLTGVGDMPEAKAKNLAQLALHLLAHGRTDIAYEIAQAALDAHPAPLAVEVREACELIYLEEKFWPLVPNGWLIAEKDDPKYAELGLAMADESPEAVLKRAETLAETDRDPRLAYLTGVLALKALQFEKAERYFAEAAKNEAFVKDNPEIDFFMGRALDRRMKFQDSLRHLARYNLWRKENDRPIKTQPEGEGPVIEIPIDVVDDAPVP